MNLVIEDIEALSSAAPRLLDFIGQQRIVLFDAPMGAGKTTLISALCLALGVKDQPASPTFSIVNEYQSPSGPVYHFDFYRLRDEQEAFDLGYEDYFYSGNYCFIEWPEKIPSLIPPHAVLVHISVLPDGKRQVTLKRT